MLSALGANDCGYLNADSVIKQVNATMKTLDRLEKYEGHLLNWYNIETLEPLEPRYVSTVDSGNLLGCLWTLEIGIGELLDAPLLDPVILHGAWDTLDILKDVLTSTRSDDPHMQTFNKLAQTLESSPGNLEELIRAIRHASGLSIALSYGLRRSAGTGDGAAYWGGQIGAADLPVDSHRGSLHEMGGDLNHRGGGSPRAVGNRNIGYPAARAS